ncbi:MAG: hypothetical protein LUQ65_13855 [Candidatus Helarchaeota archaeon]|nr:hypothetical protein [Candidatus Helarchaeota archaeon]
MDAIIKIGGSILQSQDSNALFKRLIALRKQFSFVILPGGGAFANLVREYYRTYQLSEDKAHWMAILCENILGFLILEKLEAGAPVFELSEIPTVLKTARIPVFLPFQHLFTQDPLPHSWEVTSDSIAAYLAERLKAQKLILIKDVDGIYRQDPKTSPKNGMTFLDSVNLNSNVLSNLPSCCIDAYLPVLLKKYGGSCYIVNGLHPERVEKILRGEKAIYTLLEM